MSAAPPALLAKLIPCPPQPPHPRAAETEGEPEVEFDESSSLRCGSRDAISRGHASRSAIRRHHSASLPCCHARHNGPCPCDGW